MSKKYDNFMNDLQLICRKHYVCVSVSLDGQIDAWDDDV
jgi:hypothetical protein